MTDSNTIKTITKFYDLIGLDHDPTNEEKEFIYNFSLELAKVMLNEFDDDSLRKLAQILLLFVDLD